MNMEKQNIKREIYERTWFSKQKNEENIASLSDSILLSAYQNLTKKNGRRRYLDRCAANGAL